MSGAAMPPHHVLLVNVGTPEEPTAAAVRRFLREFLSDPLVVDLPRWLWWPLLHGVILRTRPGRVARRYRQVWTDEGAPLDRDMRRLSRALEPALPGAGSVRVAYRYGPPSLRQVLDSLADRGEPVVVLPLFPQPTAATTGTIRQEAEAAWSEAGPGSGGRPHLAMASIPPDDPDYVEALAERCRQAFAGAARPPDHLLVSFHSILERVDEAAGRAYRNACEQTASALVAALDWDRGQSTLTYQSRFGPARWLGPSTESVLRELPAGGCRQVAVVCPGFLTEGLETLEEIGLRGRATFRRAGGEALILVPAPADHPAMIRALQRAAGAALVSRGRPA